MGLPWAAFLIVSALSMGMSTTARGSDEQERYGVKGAGAARCSAFVEAFDQKKETEMAMFLGWIDGFVTGVNQERKGLFDLAPWQSSQVLAHALVGFCRENGQLALFQAMVLLKKQLLAKALNAATPILVAKRGDKAVVIYGTVLQQVRSRLFELGYLRELPKGEAFDELTAGALLRFQREKGLKETGLPDQVTLSRLLH